MTGAIARSKQLADEIPNSWIPSQFDNPSNMKFINHHSCRDSERLSEGFDYLYPEWVRRPYNRCGRSPETKIPGMKSLLLNLTITGHQWR